MEHAFKAKSEQLGLKDWEKIFTEDRYPLIYEELIDKNRAFSQSVPLSLVVRMLYSVWKTEEWFPTDGSKPKDKTKCSIV